MSRSLVLFALFATTTAFSGELDGKQFCRDVKGGGLGQPANVVRKHCVEFKDDVMTDNANTFFGNPPESIRYVLVGGKILVVRDGEIFGDYSVSADGKVIKNGAGAILESK